MKFGLAFIILCIIFQHPLSAQRLYNDDLISDTTGQVDLIDVAKARFSFSPQKTKRKSKKKVVPEVSEDDLPKSESAAS